MTHKKLLAAAEEAIDCLFSDISVSAEKTAEDLSDLRTNIDIKIESIRADLKQRKNPKVEP